MQYVEEIGVLDYQAMFNNEKDKLEKILNENMSKQKIDRTVVEEIIETFRNWYETFLKEWDRNLERLIVEAIKSGHKKKLQLELGVYNFSDKQIPEAARDILKLGKKAVPLVNKGVEAALSKFEDELYQYLTKYRRQIQKQPMIEIPEPDVKEWLEKAITDTDAGNDEHREFYTGLLQNLDQSYAMVERESLCSGENLTSTKLKTLLDYENHVWNEADKGLGFILLPCESMLNAEEEMRKKLDAEKVNETEKEVVEQVQWKIILFEKDLTIEQLEVMNEYVDRRRIPDNEIKIPFLKLNGKIAKLTKAEISEKRIDRLGFRPVQDSVFWALNNYSFILMLFLRELNTKVYDKRKELEKISVVNGAQFAAEMKALHNKRSDKIALIAADMDNAYTNVKLQDLVKAVEVLCKEINAEKWKLELIIKLAKLVLNNNYVEASIGILKIGPCLPMGNCASGEALDTVAIASEMEKENKKALNLKLTEEIPEQIGKKINLQKYENEGSRSTQNITKRYRDDIYGMIAVEDENDMLTNILDIGQVYPKHIKLTVELGHLYQSFLDVCHSRRLSDGGFTTFVRRNFNVPPLFMPEKSSVPEILKWSALKCELLRHRRICSSSKLVEVNDYCLDMEYQKLGYKNWQVKKMTKKCLESYKTRYDEAFNMVEDRKIPETVLFGTKTVYEGFHKTHEILRTLIKRAEAKETKMPVIVPGTKLKTYLFTKRKYLMKQRKYMEESRPK